MGILEKNNEEAVFLTWVEKKKRMKIQKRLLIVCNSRIISIKPGGKVSYIKNMLEYYLQVARDAHYLELIEMKSLNPREVI